MGFAKALVIFMTLAIVAGLGLLVYGIATRGAKLSGDGADLGRIELEVPAGSRLRALTAADGRLYLTLEDEEGRTSILILDETTGRTVGDIRLRDGAAVR